MLLKNTENKRCKNPTAKKYIRKKTRIFILLANTNFIPSLKEKKKFLSSFNLIILEKSYTATAMISKIILIPNQKKKKMFIKNLFSLPGSILTNTKNNIPDIEAKNTQLSKFIKNILNNLKKFLADELIRFKKLFISS